MHRCLQIPEIQSAIVKTIRSTIDNTVFPTRKSNDFMLQDLVSLAITSQHFTGAALGALWEKQRDLTTIIKVLPSNLWTKMRLPQRVWEEGLEDEMDREEEEEEGEEGEQGDEYYGVILKMTRPIEENDWVRFDYYSSKINTLSIGTRDLSNLHESVYIRLCAYRPTRTLFPNLRSFTLSIDYIRISPHMTYLPIFLGNNLQRFEMEVAGTPYFDAGPDAGHICHFLRAVSRACPFLRSITLPSLSQDLLINQNMFSLEEFIARFSHVESVDLRIEDTSPAVMARLGLMPRLSNLCVGTNSSWRKDRYPGPQLAWVTGGFRFLKALELPPLTPDEVRDILLGLSTPLHALDISYKHGYDVVDLPTQWLNELNHLLIHYAESDSFVELHTHTIPSHPLSSLFTLRNLRVISICHSNNQPFTDPWLREISSCWPQLEELDVYPTSDDPHIRMTLEGLAQITQNCKKLVKLSISVQCCAFNIEHPKYARIASQSIRYLLLHRSVLGIERPWKVLRCISVMFPKLAEARGYPPKSLQPDERAWEQLNDAFKDAFSLV